MAAPVWHQAGSEPEAIARFLIDKRSQTEPFAPRIYPSQNRAMLHQAALLVLREDLADSNTAPDRLVSQEVRAVEDLVRVANLLMERLREWYALHAPEAVRELQDGPKFAELVATFGGREGLAAHLERMEFDLQSVGTKLDEADVVVLQSFASALHQVYQSWTKIEARIQDSMVEIAPRLSGMLGATIAAKMVAQAGNLQRLASFPASTFQLLGAETALFRHIKQGTAPPKHGILFQHPHLHAAPPHKRGRIAKALGNLGSRAAKLDAFGDPAQAEVQLAELKSELDRRLARIPNEPPKRGPRGPGRGPGGPRGGPSRGPGGPSRGGPGGYRRDGPPRDGGRGPPRGGGGGGYRRDGPPRDGPRREGPPRSGGYQRDGPPRDGGYRRDGPPRDGPRRDGPPRSGGYQRDGPPRGGGGGGYRRDGPPRDGPRRDGPPRSGGYQRDGPPRDGNRGPPRDRYDANGPPRQRRVRQEDKERKGPARAPGRKKEDDQ